VSKEGVNMESLKIRISGLSSGIHEYDFSVDPSVIGLDGNFHSPVKIHAYLDKATRQIFFKVDIQTTGRFQCDRCLEEFQQSLTTAYSLVYRYDQEEAARDQGEEIQHLTPDTVYIDPTEDVRQMIMLSIPLKLLCREECKGLCPHCGKNLNIATCTCEQKMDDPRWDTLQSLLDQ
jgi:uncharacterized protein